MGYYAIIDRRDGAEVQKHNWCALVLPRTNAVYAVTSAQLPDGRWTTLRLHRFLWRLWRRPDVPELDHKNLDGLDNRRPNVRAATSTQNKTNRLRQRNNKSGFKGVCWNKAMNKWIAQIRFRGRRTVLGYFVDPAKAARAYAKAAHKMHGAFARI